ncbi:MAG: hypothetical protein ABL995_15905 [Bryobacteraceae bacterium]
MRRALASLLLLLFSLALASPLFASDPESNLPACCRRNGKHQCNMRTGGDSGPGIQAAACPLYSLARGASAQPNTLALGLSFPTSAILLLCVCLALCQWMMLLRLSFDRTGQKRGPPALFA